MRIRFCRTITAVLAFALLPLTAALAQKASSPQTNVEPQSVPGYHPPTLQVTTRIVVLDVTVTDKKGNIVTRPLTRGDFEVFEDKQPQKIRFFEPPSQHQMPDPGQAIVHSSADLAKIGDAPVTILVLDELNSQFLDMSYARQMLVKYLERQPKVLPEPTVLMVASNLTFQQIHDYTQDRDALIEAVKKHRPELPWKMMISSGNGPGAVERLAQVLVTLEQIAKASTGTPGKKNLIWVGVGFPTFDVVQMDPKDSDSLEAAIRRCTAELMAARVTMYTIDPTANSSSILSTAIPDDGESDMLASSTQGDPFFGGDTSFTSLAPATGGVAFVGRNDIDNLIGQDIAKGQEYYTLSYSPTNQSDDPLQFRRIRVIMKDPNLRAITRNGYYPQPSDGIDPSLNKQDAEKLARNNLALDLATGLTSTMTYNGLDVSADKLNDHQWQIKVAEKNIDWSEPDARGQEHTEDTLAAAWFSPKGKLLGHIATEQMAGRRNPSAGASYTMTIPLPSNVARVRILVRDALSGRMGTVDITNF